MLHWTPKVPPGPSPTMDNRHLLKEPSQVTIDLLHVYLQFGSFSHIL